MFSSHALQNLADFDKLLDILYWIYLPQKSINNSGEVEDIYTVIIKPLFLIKYICLLGLPGLRKFLRFLRRDLTNSVT